MSWILGLLLFVGFIYYQFKLEKLREEVVDLTILLNSHPLRYFTNIEVGEKFRLYWHSSIRDCWSLDIYQIISLPDQRFQLVEIDKDGKVTGISKMGIKDTLEEVAQYLKENRYLRDRDDR